jgi:23S rRNA pseudouridine2605 synthase
LAECGAASRRKSEAFIEAGRVRVNGQPAELGMSVTPGRDSVTLDGEPVERDKKVYVILNKPQGVVSTASDPQGRPTVTNLLEGLETRVFPVGRLDIDVGGALILTNDGELANRLMHPRYEVEKVYMAWVKGAPAPKAITQLERGVKLDDGPTAPAKARVMKRDPRNHTTLLRLVIHEGRKHEVKRMLEAVGHPVVKLERGSVGGVTAKGLKPGQWRVLTPQEIDRLRRATERDPRRNRPPRRG